MSSMNVEPLFTSIKDELDDLRSINPNRMERVMQKFRLDWNDHSNSIKGLPPTQQKTPTPQASPKKTYRASLFS